jgi:hypothetical protein
MQYPKLEFSCSYNSVGLTVYNLAHRGLRVFVQVWDSEEHVTLPYKHVLYYEN